MGINTPTGDDRVDSIDQALFVFGMNSGNDLFQTQTIEAQSGVKTKRLSEGFVDGKAVGRQVPMPGTDNRTRGEGELNAVDVRACDGFAGAQSLLGVASFRHVTEDDCNLSISRFTDTHRSDFKPALERLGVILEIGRFAGFGDMAISLKPETLQVWSKLGHPLATQIDTGLTFKGRIDLDEPVVYRAVVCIELDLNDGERCFDGLQHGSGALFALAQRVFCLLHL